jgi:hypothetical protein
VRERSSSSWCPRASSWRAGRAAARHLGPIRLTNLGRSRIEQRKAQGRGLAGEHRAHVFGTCGAPNARRSEPVLPAPGDQADRGHPWVASSHDSAARADDRGDGRTGDAPPRRAGDRTTTSLLGQDRRARNPTARPCSGRTARHPWPAGPEADQVVIAFPWRQRGTAEALAREVPGGPVGPPPSRDDRSRGSQQMLRSASSQSHPVRWPPRCRSRRSR